jgi:hypothetical protein
MICPVAQIIKRAPSRVSFVVVRKKNGTFEKAALRGGLFLAEADLIVCMPADGKLASGRPFLCKKACSNNIVFFLLTMTWTYSILLI